MTTHLEPLDDARVVAVDRASYAIRGIRADVPAELSGRFRFRSASAEQLPCVGDHVRVRYHSSGEAAVIHEVLERRGILRRKQAGRSSDSQLIGSNLDTAFIVQSCHYDFNPRRLDRYVVMVNDGGIDPVIVLTKSDLVTRAELSDRISAARTTSTTSPIITLSNVTGEGTEEFRSHLRPGMTHCLIGSSGVGKTSLINRLLGSDALATADVSGTGEGRHTTSRRQLIELPGGALLIDTPGMRELGVVTSPDGLETSFINIAKLARACRFGDCTHTGEPGCAVSAAIAAGELSEERCDSFLKLAKESEHHEKSHLEKRRKDKALGKFYKAAKRDVRKYGGR